MRTVVILVLCCMLHVGLAAEILLSPEPTLPTTSQENTTSILNDFLERTENAQQLSFNVQSLTSHTFDGGRTTDVISFDFARIRPDKLAMTMRLDKEVLRVVINGDQMLMALQSRQEFVQCAPPKHLDTFIGWLTHEPVFRQLFTEQPFSDWGQYSTTPLRNPPPGSEGYALVFPSTDLRVWLRRDDAGNPQPQRVIADMSRGGNHPQGTHTTALDFASWQTEGPIAPDRFDLSPPKGYSEVDWFSSAKEEGTPQVHYLQTLIGAPAPPFNLERLTGDPVSLSALRGEKVILLDFWTTWCRPCRHTLEVLDTLREEFGDSLYTLAINVMETKEEVAFFKEKFGYQTDMALDPNGHLAADFGVDVFPSAILIGLEGTIQSIHIGNERLREQMLAKEIKRIIAGNELVESKERYTAKERLHYRLEFNATDYCYAFVEY